MASPARCSRDGCCHDCGGESQWWADVGIDAEMTRADHGLCTQLRPPTRQECLAALCNVSINTGLMAGAKAWSKRAYRFGDAEGGMSTKGTRRVHQRTCAGAVRQSAGPCDVAKSTLVATLGVGVRSEGRGEPWRALVAGSGPSVDTPPLDVLWNQLE